MHTTPVVDRPIRYTPEVYFIWRTAVAWVIVCWPAWNCATMLTKGGPPVVTFSIGAPSRKKAKNNDSPRRGFPFISSTVSLICSWGVLRRFSI